MKPRAGLILLCLLAAACAEVGRPPGGPVDRTPPRLLHVEPESLATSVAPDLPLTFDFDEKLQRRGFAASLELVPPVRVSKPRFDGLRVRVEPMEGWPADSVVVWTLRPTLKDKHGVALGSPRQGAFSTAERLPAGQIRGRAVWEGAGEKEKVDFRQLWARLTLEPAEGSRRRRDWRWAQGDPSGAFELDLLRIPSGPYQLEVFLDRNGDERRNEREPVAVVDSLYLAESDSILLLDPDRLRLVDLEAPVTVSICLGEAASDSVPLILAVEGEEGERPQKTSVDSTGCAKALQLAPGHYRLGGWLDQDRDGLFGPDSTGISELFLEPIEFELQPATPESLEVAWPSRSRSWAEMDSLKLPPLPRSLMFSNSP